MSVNPPPIPRMPKQWFSDPNIRAYQDAISKIIFQLWVRSDSGPLSTTVTNQFISSLISYGGERQEHYAHQVSSAYTTVGNEMIDATTALTITLNTLPEDLEIVKINHQGAYNETITITDGTGTDYIHVPGDSVVYCYSVDLGRWV